MHTNPNSFEPFVVVVEQTHFHIGSLISIDATLLLSWDLILLLVFFHSLSLFRLHQLVATRQRWSITALDMVAWLLACLLTLHSVLFVYTYQHANQNCSLFRTPHSFNSFVRLRRSKIPNILISHRRLIYSQRSQSREITKANENESTQHNNNNNITGTR